jgi:ribosomal protein S18 acetylase RimI-like enzyme
MCDRAPQLVVVAECANTVVGYASFDLTHGGAVGVVGNNAVAPQWQGRGIGGQLIRQVIRELAGRGVQLLEVATFDHDLPAQRVYERCGFELVAKTRHYFRAPGPRSME